MPNMIDLLGAQSVAQNTQGALAGVSDSLTEGAKVGMGLAQAKQDMDAKKVQTAAMEDQLETAKFNKVTGMLNTLAKTNPQIAKRMIPAMKEQLQKSGIPVDDSVLDLMASDPEYKKRMLNIQQALSGKATDPEVRMQALQAFQDIGAFDKGLELFANQSKQEQALAIAQSKIDAMERLGVKKAEASAAGVERKAVKQEYDIINNASKEFQKMIKDDQIAMDAAERAEALLTNGGTISSEAAKSTIARMFEKGVLTDQDLARLSGGKSLFQQGAQLAEKAVSGKLTDENRDELLKIVNTLKPVYEQKVSDKADVYAQSQSEISSIPKDQFLKSFSGANLVNKRKQAPPPPSDKIKQFIDAQKAKGKTDEEIKSFLKSKGVN